MDLSERKLKILQAIISDYIKTAEPVGSRTLSKQDGLNYSPATIRNEMADLEELGYILQPHTSAGRIPTNSGYRLYVDSSERPGITRWQIAQCLRDYRVTRLGRDLGLLCQSPNINKWAKYKPEDINTPQVITEQQRVLNNYGIVNIPTWLRLEYMANFIFSTDRANVQRTYWPECDDAAGAAEKLKQEGIKPDVVIVDPPRKGCDETLLDTMVKMQPKRIVYVSCNPATQARDLSLLDAKYKVMAVQPVDMFPYTHHVENVVLLEKR